MAVCFQMKEGPQSTELSGRYDNPGFLEFFFLESVVEANTSYQSDFFQWWCTFLFPAQSLSPNPVQSEVFWLFMAFLG